MKKSLLCLSLALMGALVSCGGASVRNKDKPLIFYNRQPSDPTTGEVDMVTMNHNDKTYYVGYDAAGGGGVQGNDLIVDYLKTKTKKDLGIDGDTLNYVLCIGDAGHNDSKARTYGVRLALNTWNGSCDANNTKEGEVEISDGNGGYEKIKVKEVAAQEMKNTSGATWDATTAKEAVSNWKQTLKDKGGFQMVVANNDGMAMGALQAYSGKEKKPLIFGYDANYDALESIADGELTGTVTQNADAQAAGTLQVIRNILDGETGEDVYHKGFTTPDKWGNQISAKTEYAAAEKAVLAKNDAITKENVDRYFIKGGSKRDDGVKQLPSNAPTYKVLLTVYNSSDNFLSSTYVPALKYYAPLMNLDVTYVQGDGQNESGCLDKFINLGNFDAYAVNMVKTNSGADYLFKLKY